MLRSTKRRDRRWASPRIEGLEDRKLLYATLGASWTYGSRITYSFAPDGTNIGGAASVLNQAMANRGITTSQWETAFEKAAAVWQQVTNINIAQVSDDGAAFGAAGDQQDDPNFGDIRIGGTALGSGVLASTFLPPPINGNSLAGDMVFNTNQMWGINNNYDIETVAIHEFGHALGMDHSATTTADLYAYYNADKQALTSDDIAGIQSIYGTRRADAFDAGTGNQALASASNISSYLNGSTQETLTGLDINSGADLDWYTVTAPAGSTTNLTVTVQSSNLSSLAPQVSLYNGARALVQTASSTNFGATINVAATGVQPGQVFYIKVWSANTGAVGNNGAYALLVNFGSSSMSPAAPPNTVVTSQSGGGGGSSNDSLGDPSAVSTGDDVVQIGDLNANGDNMMIAPGARLRGGRHKARDASHHHPAARVTKPQTNHVAGHAGLDKAIDALHGRG